VNTIDVCALRRAIERAQVLEHEQRATAALQRAQLAMANYADASSDSARAWCLQTATAAMREHDEAGRRMLLLQRTGLGGAE
jgi:hypothetical protein